MRKSAEGAPITGYLGKKKRRKGRTRKNMEKVSGRDQE